MERFISRPAARHTKHENFILRSRKYQKALVCATHVALSVFPFMSANNLLTVHVYFINAIFQVGAYGNNHKPMVQSTGSGCSCRSLPLAKTHNHKPAYRYAVHMPCSGSLTKPRMYAYMKIPGRMPISLCLSYRPNHNNKPTSQQANMPVAMKLTL